MSPTPKESAVVILDAAVALATERVIAPIEGMHREIAARWFEPLGPLSGPVRDAHDAISNVVYGSIRIAGRAAGIGLDTTLSIEPETNDAVQALANGLWGDELGRYEDRLATSMAVHDRNGAPISVGPDLGAAFPTVGSRLIVLVHGLFETERCWAGTDDAPGLTQRLEASPDLTQLAIRYNSGLPVSTSGSQLSLLLDAFHAHWPIAVRSIALVGHSMGGLVIRGACEAARAAGHRWIDDVTDVVTLGSPHRGSPLEKGVNATAWSLGISRETRPLARFLEARSAGIKDLRFGAISEDDWGGVDRDALLRNTVRDHPLPPDIDHHFVSGVVTSNPNHPVGVIVGDLVVRTASGTGAQFLDATNAVIFGGVRHDDLLHEPVVVDRVMDWVEERERPG